MTQDDDLRSKANRLMGALRSSQEAQGEQVNAKSVSTSVTRLRAPGVDLLGLGQALVRWYEGQNYEAQALPESDRLIVQCRNRGRWKAAVGMSLSLAVLLRREGAELVIEVSGAKWLDKGVVAGLGAATALPVLIAPAAWGAWVQARMPDRTVDFLKAAVPDHLGIRSPAAPTSPRSVSPPEQDSASNPGGSPVDLNAASAEELGALPGVGLILGKKVVRERDARGGFRSIDDFVRVVGPSLKPHLLEQLRPRLTVGAPPLASSRSDLRSARGRRIGD